MYISLALAKVPSLYHFYGVIFLGRHCSAKGELNSANTQAEGLHRFTFSFYLSHLKFPSLLPFLSPCTMFPCAPTFSHHPSSLTLSSPSSSLWFSTCNPFIHFCCSFSWLEERDHRQCENMQTFFSLSLLEICNLKANFEVQVTISDLCFYSFCFSHFWQANGDMREFTERCMPFSNVCVQVKKITKKSFHSYMRFR